MHYFDIGMASTGKFPLIIYDTVALYPGTPKLWYPILWNPIPWYLGLLRHTKQDAECVH